MSRVPAWIQSWVKPDTITAHSLLPLQHPEEGLILYRVTLRRPALERKNISISGNATGDPLEDLHVIRGKGGRADQDSRRIRIRPRIDGGGHGRRSREGVRGQSEPGCKVHPAYEGFRDVLGVLLDRLQRV